jgi:hypothetical protein
MASASLTVRSRLLPALTGAEIHKLATAKLAESHSQLDEYEAAINNEPVRFFRSNPRGECDFMTGAGGYLQRPLFLVGNRSGKAPPT